MTLKEFAAQSGINYQTAKTLKRRGKIVEVSGRFQIVEENETPAETLGAEKVSKVKPAGETLVETLKPQVETCPECETLKLLVSHWQSRFEKKEQDGEVLQSRLELLQSENADLRAQIVTDSFDPEPEPLEPQSGGYDRHQVIALLQATIRQASGHPVTPKQVSAMLANGNLKPQRNGLYSVAHVSRVLDGAANADWSFDFS